MKRFLLIIAILVIPLIAGAGDMASLSDGTITVTSAAQSITMPTTGTAQYAILTVETDSVRVAWKSTPTATTGHLVTAGQTIYLNSGTEIGEFQVILNSGASGSTIKYSIFGQTN